MVVYLVTVSYEEREKTKPLNLVWFFFERKKFTLWDFTHSFQAISDDLLLCVVHLKKPQGQPKSSRF